MQLYDPWGKVRFGTNTQTKLNYTGQRKDDTGLLYYGSRYYDPNIARFTNADTIVPGMAMGAGGALGSVGTDSASSAKGLTVAYQETSFAAAVAGENQLTFSKGFYFQLSSRDRQQAKAPYGPLNPQALNRYSYVLNNPIRYSDPTGHWLYLSSSEASQFIAYLQQFINIANGNSDRAGAFREFFGFGLEAEGVAGGIEGFTKWLSTKASWLSKALGPLAFATIAAVIGTYIYQGFVEADIATLNCLIAAIKRNDRGQGVIVGIDCPMWCTVSVYNRAADANGFLTGETLRIGAFGNGGVGNVLQLNPGLRFGVNCNLSGGTPLGPVFPGKRCS